jgi:hypothetical protein
MEDKVSRATSPRTIGIALVSLAGLIALTLFSMNSAYAENAASGVDDSGSAAAVRSAEAAEVGLLVISEDGVTRYSTDGGASWIEGYPEGAEVQTDGQGRTTVSIGANGAPPVSGTLSGTSVTDSLAVSVNESEDGTIRYSTDGGATWSDQAPEGVTATEEPDGKVTVSSGEGSILAQQGGINAE